jgi:oligopeptide transport system permease protein
MLRYILIRTVWVFVILFTVLTINFVIFKLAPSYPPFDKDQRDIYYALQVTDGYMTERVENDPVIIAAIQSGEIKLPRGSYTALESNGTSMRIFEPIPVSIQYFQWLNNVRQNNWGVSTRLWPNVPVFQILGLRIPVTLRLNLVALFVYIPIGFALGIFAALKKNSVADNAISLGVMIFISTPSFVLMLFLVLVFGYQLGWLPYQFPAADVTGIRFFTGMILPVLGLSFGSIAGLTRFTRAELSEVLTSEFVLLARTKGLSRPQAVVRHAMRNSMVPLVPSIIGSFVGLLSGSVIIERIYGIPGAGQLYLDSLQTGNYDYNLLLALGAFYTSIGLFASLLVDLSYGLVDPRIRMGGRK